MNREKDSTISQLPLVNTLENSKHFAQTVRSLKSIYDCIMCDLD
jgi:hypothetical protein